MVKNKTHEYQIHKGIKNSRDGKREKEEHAGQKRNSPLIKSPRAFCKCNLEPYITSHQMQKNYTEDPVNVEEKWMKVRILFV